MALIKCPECGREISDKAESCPHCGNPISLEKKPPEMVAVQVKPIKKKNKIDSCILAFILTGIIPTIILFAMHNAMGKYGMNPLAYIVCILPIILTSPLLLFVGGKDKNKDNKK